MSYLWFRILVILLFNFVFWSPEINFYWSTKPKVICVVELFDTILCFFYVFVKDVTLLIATMLLIVNNYIMIFKFDRQNNTSFFHLSSEFVKSDTLWNIFDKDIILIEFRKVFSNLIRATLDFTLFFIDMLLNNDCFSINILFHWNFFNCVFSAFMSCKINKTWSTVFSIDFTWFYFSKLFKNFPQFFTCKVFWEVSYKQVCELSNISLSPWVFGLLNTNLNFLFFVTLFTVVKSLDSSFGTLFIFKLNISKSPAGSIIINFKFAWLNSSILSKKFRKRCLIHFLW